MCRDMTDEQRTAANEGFFSAGQMAKLWNKFRRQRDKDTTMLKIWDPYASVTILFLCHGYVHFPVTCNH